MNKTNRQDPSVMPSGLAKSGATEQNPAKANPLLDRWSDESLRKKEERLIRVVSNTTGDFLASFREKTLVPALRQAQIELMKRAHAQGAEGKRFTSDFMKEQKALINHILILHKHYQLSAERVRELKRESEVVEEIVMKDTFEPESLPRPRWDSTTMGLKERRIATIMAHVNIEHLSKFSEDMIRPTLRKAQEELKRRASAQGESGKKYSSSFMKENKALIEHILTVHNQYKKASDMVSDFEFGQLRLSLKENAPSRQKSHLRLAVDNSGKTSSHDGSAQVSKPSFLRSTLAKAASIAAVAVTGTLGWMGVNVGGPDQAAAATPSSAVAAFFRAARSLGQEGSIKNEPTPLVENTLRGNESARVSAFNASVSGKTFVHPEVRKVSIQSDENANGVALPQLTPLK